MALRIDSFEVDVTVRRKRPTKRRQPPDRAGRGMPLGPFDGASSAPSSGSADSRPSGSAVTSDKTPVAAKVLARAEFPTPLTPAVPAPVPEVTDGMLRFISPPIEAPSPKPLPTAVAPAAVQAGNGDGLKPLFKRPAPLARTTPPDAERLARAGGTGRALDEATRKQMEGFFGADLGDVRVHANAQAAQAAASQGAEAFTIGRDIYFGQGKFDPSSQKGKALLGHELTHVLQQRTIDPRRQGMTPRSVEELETEAQTLARRFETSAAEVKGTGFLVNRYLCTYSVNRPATDEETQRLEALSRGALKVCEDVLRSRYPDLLEGAARTLDTVEVDIDTSLAGHTDEEIIQVWGRRVAAAIAARVSRQSTPTLAAASGAVLKQPGKGKGQQPATNITVTTQTFDIEADDLDGAATALQSLDEWGKTRWNVTYDYDATDGVATSVTVTARITVELPRWTTLSKQPRRVQAEWNRMLTALRRHENEHVRIARERIQQLAGELLGKPESDLPDIHSRCLQDLDTLSDAFDQRTDHGQKQGVTLDLNAAAQPKAVAPASTPGMAEAEALMLERAIAAGSVQSGEIHAANPGSVQRKELSWHEQRVVWVRDAILRGDFAGAVEPYGAFYILNGLSMQDMIRILKALGPQHVTALRGALKDTTTGAFDRERLRTAIDAVLSGSTESAEKLQAKAVEKGDTNAVDSLKKLIVEKNFHDVFIMLNAMSMAGLLRRLEQLGTNWLLELAKNVNAAPELGEGGRLRVDAAIRAVAMKLHGSTVDTLDELKDAMDRAALPADQQAAIRKIVPLPRGGYTGMIEEYFNKQQANPLLPAGSPDTAALDRAFRLLNGLSDSDMRLALQGVTKGALEWLTRNSKRAEGRYDVERLRQALHQVWSERYPHETPPWDTVEQSQVASMSTTEKLAEAIRRAPMDEEVKNHLAELLSPESLAMMAGFSAVFAAAQLTPPGWIADLILAGLTIVTVVMIGNEVIDIGENLSAFVTKATNARSDPELDAASVHFAKAVSKATIDIILAILTHKATKAVGSGKSNVAVDISKDGKVVRVPVEEAQARTSKGQSAPDQLDELFAKLERGEIPQPEQPKPSTLSRQPGQRLDIEGPDAPGQRLGRGVVVRARQVLGRRLGGADNSVPQGVVDAWQRARAHVEQGGPLTEANAPAYYKAAQARFWAEVRAGGQKGYFEDAGFAFPEDIPADVWRARGQAQPPKGGAPVLRAAVDSNVPVDEFRLSLDHTEPKAAPGNWRYALDGDKLELRVQADNVKMSHLERKFPELRR